MTPPRTGGSPAAAAMTPPAWGASPGMYMMAYGGPLPYGLAGPAGAGAESPGAPSAGPPRAPAQPPLMCQHPIPALHPVYCSTPPQGGAAAGGSSGAATPGSAGYYVGPPSPYPVMYGMYASPPAYDPRLVQNYLPPMYTPYYGMPPSGGNPWAAHAGAAGSGNPWAARAEATGSGSPAPGVAAPGGAGAAPEAPPAAEPEAAQPAGGAAAREPLGLARLNLPLIFRLLFFLFLINQDGNQVRLAAMGALCVAIYLHQVGALRRLPRFVPRIRVAPADPRAGAGAAHGRGGLGAEVTTAVVAFFASLIPTWSIEDHLEGPPPQRQPAEHEHQD